MPNSPHTPRTLTDWLKQLDTPLLPASSESVQKMRRGLMDSNCSMRELAELMSHCPALALAVLREANRSTSTLSNKTESLEAALNRLGLKRAEALLSQLPTAAETALPPALRQIQLISLHASQQASGLFSARLARLWQEIHWGSLLFLAPVWVLVAHKPELFEAWEQRILINKEPASRVEQELLGMPLLTLCLALSEHWQLPDWIIQGYRLLLNDRRLLVKALHLARDSDNPLRQQQNLDADASLCRWLTQPANSILLANGLAISAHYAWNSDHNLRWQRLTSLFLKVPLTDLQQLVHQNAVNSARQHARTGLWHPAESLLWPWPERRLQAIVKHSKVELSQEWRQLCLQLLANPTQFSNVLQLTDTANQALKAGGFTRILLFLADRQHSRLQAQQQTGLDKACVGMALAPQQSQVLRGLLEEPRQLRLTPANVAKFSALLPGALKSLFPSEHWLLRSIAANNRVVMLIVADQDGQPLGDSDMQTFSKTVQCIERALTNFANRGR
ncbi:HDOD domain-containing protein [Ectopseudomonas mendocina]|uniref:HDOD domain-containing protein n=1 Tax=Ectopseudomonas mendocina TaxID=300 RepID=A0ABZ2RDV6_ECTME